MQTLSECQQRATQLAQQFRLGITTQAALELATLAEDLIRCFNPGADTAFTVQQCSELQAILVAILQCQQQRDWLGLADYLEYELAALLQAV